MEGRVLTASNPDLGRRAILRGATFLTALAIVPPTARRAMAESTPAPSGPVPFSFDTLVDRAKAAAMEPYEPPYRPAPEIVSTIDYATWGAIKFQTDKAPFSGAPDVQGPPAYPLEFFHLGQYFTASVQMNLVVDGMAHRVAYDPALFDMPADSPARKLPADAGFAGFRFQEWHDAPDWRTQDWVAFLGASYFRAIGDQGQYGLSARGAVVNAALPDRPEEFPDFREFYISESGDPEQPITVCAYLDGPSVTGAFRFRIQRGLDRAKGIIMEIESNVFMREDVGRLGLIPMTSMFWYSEYGQERIADWRPEVHDSDGLAIWSGTGERIWRPLNNPSETRVSAYLDDNPRGFGLLQRDRNFDHYQDGVFYDRRPSLWVEPIEALGKGEIQLMEIPTDDEIHDNIGAFWVPDAPAVKGSAFRLHYRLYWKGQEPFPALNIAQTVATRIGSGGEPGKPRPENQYRIAVEFDRPDVLKRIPYGVMSNVNVTTSAGRVIRTLVEPVPNGNVWRAIFDLELPPDQVADLRLYLDLNGEPLTETWSYQLET
ncbi:MAG: glucan biosynthesis protein D [Paracoccus denitrificans]|nr:MAG: glucan biosynthesis protein D [Paracoccus denitrificans]PZO86207.1 MAG: glucan biosynthesis protein D [Paracoccus denitrificans]